jgi:hypothetical protein
VLRNSDKQQVFGHRQSLTEGQTMSFVIVFIRKHFVFVAEEKRGRGKGKN